MLSVSVRCGQLRCRFGFALLYERYDRSEAMDIGTTLPTGCTDGYQVSPDALRRWARDAEDAGFAGLWVLDHIVKPDTYVTSVLNPLVTLSHAAGITDTIPLGTSILLLPLRGAANTADAALSLRYLADREITLGLGAGYVPEEFEVTGIPFKQRGPRLSEGIDVLQTLFSEEGSYHSRFHDFENITIDPTVEEPPRLLAGGSSLFTDGTMPEPMLNRIVTARGWIAPPIPPEQAANDGAAIDSYAEQVGVDSTDIDRVALTYCYVVDTDDRQEAYHHQRNAFAEFFSAQRGFEHARECCLTGSVSDIHRQLHDYEDAGFDQLIVGSPAHTRENLAEQMDLLTDTVLNQWD